MLSSSSVSRAAEPEAALCSARSGFGSRVHHLDQNPARATRCANCPLGGRRDVGCSDENRCRGSATKHRRQRIEVAPQRAALRASRQAAATPTRELARPTAGRARRQRMRPSRRRAVGSAGASRPWRWPMLSSSGRAAPSGRSPRPYAAIGERHVCAGDVFHERALRWPEHGRETATRRRSSRWPPGAWGIPQSRDHQTAARLAHESRRCRGRESARTSTPIGSRAHPGSVLAVVRGGQPVETGAITRASRSGSCSAAVAATGCVRPDPDSRNAATGAWTTLPFGPVTCSVDCASTLGPTSTRRLMCPL